MPVFEDLIDRHANAPVDERGAIENAIFPKIIDYRRQIKRGKVGEEEQARMAEKIQRYTSSVRRETTGT